MTDASRLSFKENDKLGRKRFADFLYHLILHHKTYQRNADAQSYSIAIDAGYGTGKTYFLRMFEAMIKDNQEISIVHYDAWQYDCFSDALSPILSLISETDLFIDATLDQEAETKQSQFKDSLRRLAVKASAITANALNLKIVGDIINAIVSEMPKASTDAYAEYKQALNNLHTALSSCTQNRPLLFIVDELDRCSPTFAIHTLEILKHLMNVPNVVFLYALDLQQLRSTVAQVYGSDINADGYLCKLFDYITMMPVPDATAYIQMRCEKFSFSPFPNENQKNIDFMTEVLRFYNATLRQIDTIINCYLIMCEFQLYEYEATTANTLYFFCLCMKFFEPATFRRIFVLGDIKPEDRYRYKTNDTIKSMWDRIFPLINEPISATIDFCEDSYRKTQIIQIIKENQKYYRHNGLRYEPLETWEEINSIIHCLDLNNWNIICNLTHGHFIHRQLELYNFSPNFLNRVSDPTPVSLYY